MYGGLVRIASTSRDGISLSALSKWHVRVMEAFNSDVR